MRPAWRCRVCAAAWPCSPARLALLTEFVNNRVGLCQYLATQYVQALDDLSRHAPNVPRRGLYTRFLGWPSGSRR